MRLYLWVYKMFEFRFALGGDPDTAFPTMTKHRITHEVGLVRNMDDRTFTCVGGTLLNDDSFFSVLFERERRRIKQSVTGLPSCVAHDALWEEHRHDTNAVWLIAKHNNPSFGGTAVEIVRTRRRWGWWFTLAESKIRSSSARSRPNEAGVWHPISTSSMWDDRYMCERCWGPGGSKRGWSSCQSLHYIRVWQMDKDLNKVVFIIKNSV